MVTDPEKAHIPVLCNEMIEILAPEPGKVYVDATFGGGGYTRAILNAGAKKVIAFDRDQDAIARSLALKKEFGDRFEIFHACFSEMDNFLESGAIDGIVFDFGISSYQVDQAHRGFSFRQNGPLDMRMGLGAKYSAADVVNDFTEKDIAEILYRYGEESRSRKIAKAIVEERSIQPIKTTDHLAKIIRKIVPSQEGFDPATLAFQGLRIFVNNELIEIERALQLSNQLLPVGGRLVTVAFHALEDRIVKNHGQMKFNHYGRFFAYAKINRKVIAPSLEQIRSNPRCRSAKLRGFIKQLER